MGETDEITAEEEARFRDEWGGGSIVEDLKDVEREVEEKGGKTHADFLEVLVGRGYSPKKLALLASSWGMMQGEMRAKKQVAGMMARAMIENMLKE